MLNVALLTVPNSGGRRQRGERRVEGLSLV